MLSTARKYFLVPASQWNDNLRENVQLYNQDLHRQLIEARKPQVPIPVSMPPEPEIKEPIIEYNRKVTAIENPHWVSNKRKRVIYDIETFLKDSGVPRKYWSEITKLLEVGAVEYNDK